MGKICVRGSGKDMCQGRKNDLYQGEEQGQIGVRGNGTNLCQGKMTDCVRGKRERCVSVEK